MHMYRWINFRRDASKYSAKVHFLKFDPDRKEAKIGGVRGKKVNRLARKTV